MSEAIKGQCLCGETTITIENGDNFKNQILCHCWDCKQTSGSAFSTNILAPVKDTGIEGPVKEFKVTAASGNTGERSMIYCLETPTYHSMIDRQLRAFFVEIAEALSLTDLSPLARALRFRPETSGISLISPLPLNVSESTNSNELAELTAHF
jgi:hypothetical protein